MLSTTSVSGDARTGHAGALSGTEPAAAWLVSALAVSNNDWAWARKADDSPPVGHPARLPPASPPASPPVGMPEARDLHPAHPHSRSSARPPPAGTRQAAAGRVPAAGSGRAAACRQAWTHAGWRTPQRPPRGASSGARRGAGLSPRHRALAGIWPCEFPFPQLGSRNFGLGSISRTVRSPQ